MFVSINKGFNVVLTTNDHLKVKTFWEGYKIWKKSPTCFDIYTVTSKQVGDFFSNFVAFSECLDFKSMQCFDNNRLFSRHDQKWIWVSF